MNEKAVLDRNTAVDNAFRSLCFTVIKTFALCLMFQYAGRIGHVLDEIIGREIPWYSGICRTLCVLLCAGIYAYWFNPEFQGILSIRRAKRAFLLLLPAIPLIAFFCPNARDLSLDNAEIVELIGVAVAEELEYRGAVCSFAMKHVSSEKQIVPVAVISGIFFGLSHFGNVTVGMDTVSTIMQVLLASGAGMLYAAIFLRSGSIWPTCILHFMHNYMCLIMTSGKTATVTSPTIQWISEIWPVIGILCYMNFSTLFLRDPVKPEILKLWHDKWHLEGCNRKSKKRIAKETACTAVIIALVATAIIGVNGIMSHFYRDVLGCNGYYTRCKQADGSKVLTFYEGSPLKRNKQVIALVYGFGDETGCYYGDIDSDGQFEIFCQSVDEEGHSNLFLYKRIDGEIYLGAFANPEYYDCITDEISLSTIKSTNKNGLKTQTVILKGKDEDGVHICVIIEPSDIKYRICDCLNVGEGN